MTDLERAIVSFVSGYNFLAEEANQIAVSHGFWEGEGCTVGEKLNLMHDEISEAHDAYRNGNPPDNHIPNFSGLEAELADVIIRIMDFGVKNNLSIAGALIAKMEYNRTRPHKHGRENY